MAPTGTTSVLTERSTTVDQLAQRCGRVLGRELTAYLAGADSADGFGSWLAVTDEAARTRVAQRLGAAAEIIRIFAADNVVSLVRAWLREVGPAGEPPAATSIRAAGDDDSAMKNMFQAATYWVAERRLDQAAA
jgi:hypothetical protein